MAGDKDVMGPQAMRRIDRFVGIPLCLALSALRAVLRLAGRRRPPGAIRRVLFVQLAESGSMVLADPAMRALATRSGAQPYCLTFAANRASLAIAGTVPEAHIFSLRTDGLATLLADVARLLLRVRRARIDTIVDLELFSRLSAVLGLLTGVRRRAGFHRFNGVGAYRGDLYTHPVAFNSRLHVAQNYLLLVEAVLGGAQAPAPRVPVDILIPRIRRREVDAAQCAALRARWRAVGTPTAASRLVLVNANASAMLPQRRWPPAHFIALIEALLARHADVEVLLIGADEDRATTGDIAAQVGDPRCIDVAGRFALPELPALFAMSAAMVSNDSGPAHFAAVTDLPVIVLFGPETPTLFRPLGRATVLSAGLACSPCVTVSNQRSTGCRDNQCMQRISTDAVLAALCRVLEPGGAGADVGRAEVAA